MSDSSDNRLDERPWTLRDAIADGQFELIGDGEVVAWMRYRCLGPNRYFLLHTEVVHSRRGHGIGTTVVEAVLREMRSRRGAVTAICPFVAGYLVRSEQYRDLIDLSPPGD